MLRLEPRALGDNKIQTEGGAGAERGADGRRAAAGVEGEGGGRSRAERRGAVEESNSEVLVRMRRTSTDSVALSSYGNVNTFTFTCAFCAIVNNLRAERLIC